MMRYINTIFFLTAVLSLSALIMMSAAEAQTIQDKPVVDRVEIRPIDKLRTDLTNQEALLTTLLDVVEKVEQLLSKDVDIGILLNEDLPRAERIQKILSSSQRYSDAEIQGMRQEIAYLREQLSSMESTPNSASLTDHALDWSVDDITIAWARIVDDNPAAAVRINNRIYTLYPDQKTVINKHSLTLSSITALDGDQLQVVILLNNSPVTFSY